LIKKITRQTISRTEHRSRRLATRTKITVRLASIICFFRSSFGRASGSGTKVWLGVEVGSVLDREVRASIDFWRTAKVLGGESVVEVNVVKIALPITIGKADF
jgi:hypothetical protein